MPTVSRGGAALSSFLGGVGGLERPHDPSGTGNSLSAVVRFLSRRMDTGGFRKAAGMRRDSRSCTAIEHKERPNPMPLIQTIIIIEILPLNNNAMRSPANAACKSELNVPKTAV